MSWLLIHGLPTSGRYWQRLSLPGHVAAPDLPGFGDRAGEAAPATVDGFLAALRPLAGPDVCVVGVDYGGVLAAALAAEGRAGRLVLMSCALGAAWLPSRWAAHRPLAWPAYYASAGQTFLRAGDPTGSLAAAFPPADGVAGRMITVARTLRVREQRAMRDAVRAARVPTLCLWGDQDRFLPPWLGRRLAGQLGASFTTLPGAHTLAWTCPAEVSRALVAFAAGPRG